MNFASIVKFIHFIAQVMICREKTTSHVYAMKKLKKSDMLRRGQACNCKIANMLVLVLFLF